MTSERDAWTLLIQAGEVSASEGFSPSKASGAVYSQLLRELRLRQAAEDAAGAGGLDPQPLTFEERWDGLEAHADDLSWRPWPAMKQRASLARKADELDLPRLTGRDLEQLLEAAARRRRPAAEPVEPGGVFTVQPTPWAVDGVFRHGLNLLVGQPGAGKSRLAAAGIAAWLRGADRFLDQAMPCALPADERHALIVGPDQGLEDWALTLEPVGLAVRTGPTTLRLHSRVTLLPLETGTVLDADGLALIRRWCDDHPGGAVLVDSLAAVLPPGVDEDKPAAGRPVAALAEALGSCWGILTHHSRKGAGREGNLGVGAGRGSSAIDGAVSRVVGLGLIHKMEGGQPVPQESDPRRELLSTKRGGATLHLIVKSDGNGCWTSEGTADDLKRQERQERAVQGLTEAQSAVFEVLGEAEGWLTGRQVAEALLPAGEEYDARGTAAATSRRILRRLVTLGLVESVRTGLEATYRVRAGENRVNTSRGDEVLRGGSNSSPSAPQGVSPVHPGVHPGSHLFTPDPTGENKVEQGVNRQVNTENPVAAVGEPLEPPPTSHTVNGTCSPLFRVVPLDLVELDQPPIGSGADAMGDSDDPSWPPPAA